MRSGTWRAWSAAVALGMSVTFGAPVQAAGPAKKKAPVAAQATNEFDKAQQLSRDVERLIEEQGKYDEALPALAIRETALGLDHPDVANSLTNLGVDYRLRDAPFSTSASERSRRETARA